MTIDNSTDETDPYLRTYLITRHRNTSIMDDQISDEQLSIIFTEEYSQYVDSTEKTMTIDTTVQWLGGLTNYAQLLHVIDLYNKNDDLITKTAREVRSNIVISAFNYEGCLNDGIIFWNFLKTSNAFQKAPWYVRDYVVAKLFAKRISISEIL